MEELGLCKGDKDNIPDQDSGHHGKEAPKTEKNVENYPSIMAKIDQYENGISSEDHFMLPQEYLDVQIKENLGKN